MFSLKYHGKYSNCNINAKAENMKQENLSADASSSTEGVVVVVVVMRLLDAIQNPILPSNLRNGYKYLTRRHVL